MAYSKVRLSGGAYLEGSWILLLASLDIGKWHKRLEKENVLPRCESVPSIANLLVLEIFVPEVETFFLPIFSDRFMSRLKNWIMPNAGFLHQQASQSVSQALKTPVALLRSFWVEVTFQLSLDYRPKLSTNKNSTPWVKALVLFSLFRLRYEITKKVKCGHRVTKRGSTLKTFISVPSKVENSSATQ